MTTGYFPASEAKIEIGGFNGIGVRSLTRFVKERGRADHLRAVVAEERQGCVASPTSPISSPERTPLLGAEGMAGEARRRICFATSSGLFPCKRCEGVLDIVSVGEHGGVRIAFSEAHPAGGVSQLDLGPTQCRSARVVPAARVVGFDLDAIVLPVGFERLGKEPDEESPTVKVRAAAGWPASDVGERK
jgi:hypothetical protein